MMLRTKHDPIKDRVSGGEGRFVAQLQPYTASLLNLHENARPTTNHVRDTAITTSHIADAINQTKKPDSNICSWLHAVWRAIRIVVVSPAATVRGYVVSKAQ